MEASELIERLEKATGPDREIDGLIVKALCPGALLSQYLVGDDEPSVFHAQALGIADKDDVPRYTASLDAALALVERSDWRLYTVDASIRGRFSVMLASLKPQPLTDGEGREYMGTAYEYATHDSLALALCLALLKAVPNCPPQAVVAEVSSRSET